MAQYTNALKTGQQWNKLNLKYYFYGISDGSNSPDGSGALRNWTDTQKNSWRHAIDEWASVCALTLTETNTLGEADIKLFLINDNSYGYLGHAYFPGDSRKGENYISYNNAEDKDFTVGGYDYITMVHELGHTLGLAHPHDNGGTSTIFPGVSSPWDMGFKNQNQVIYTVMSYNDIGGNLTPDQEQSYGFIKGPMAYDIKVIQQIYGHTGKETGNTTYNLDTANQEGTYYEAIHDTGGTDTISAQGATKNTVINLNAATLNADGGKISKAANVDGGFTIAQGTVIENAIGGNRTDRIYGNDADNTILGKGGRDFLYASKGTDLLDGGAGQDIAIFPGTRRNYRIDKYPDRYVVVGLGAFQNRIGQTTLKNIVWIQFGNRRYRLGKLRPNRVFGGNQQQQNSNQATNGRDVLTGTGGNDVIIAKGGNDVIHASAGRDVINGGRGVDTVVFPGTRGNYKIFKYPGRYVVKGKGAFRNTVGTTTLRNIAWVKFGNKRQRLNDRMVNRIFKK